MILQLDEAIARLRSSASRSKQSCYIDWRWNRGGDTISVGLFFGDPDSPMSSFYSMRSGTNILDIVEVKATEDTVHKILNQMRAAIK
jgi:hypothetical protein